MISDNLSEFLTRQIFMHVGTRDGKLRPREIMAWGVKTNDDKKTISILIPELTSEKTLSHLENNGKISLTCVYVQTHESYQFKGTYVSHRSGNEKDYEFLETYLKGYPEIFKMIGLPVDFFSRLNYKPSVAITFNVDEIFVQTPGPNAGKKII
jgi:predicted pyridoxine 5'-phosphate oxidase superfamily flavin-nucleotide-binding protein